MPEWLLWLIKGLALGLAVAGLNYYLLLRAIRHMEKNSEEKTQKTLVKYYAVRYLLDIGTLLLAFFFLSKNAAFLLGVAFGLTIPNTFYLFKFSKTPINQRTE